MPRQHRRAELVALHPHQPVRGFMCEHAPLEQVDAADELGHEARGGELVQGGRRGYLHDAARIHHRDARGHGHGLFLVVRDHDEGGADAFLDVDQLELGAFAQPLVERAERFIQQQQLGLLCQRARQSHALALAAGQLVRLALPQLRHLHQFQHLLHSIADFAGGHAILLEAEGDVLRHAHVREQRIALEHHVHRALVRRQFGDVDAVDQHAAAIRVFESGKDAQ